MERELSKLNAKIGKLVDVIADGVRTPAIIEALKEAEDRKTALVRDLAEPAPTPLRLHPSLAELYRRRVSDLHAAISDPALKTEANEILRTLIDGIVVSASANGQTIELVGDLAAMVEIAQAGGAPNKKAALVGAALSATERRSVKVVAGAGFEPTTFRL
jgi:site-specific DNA recombinase